MKSIIISIIICLSFAILSQAQVSREKISEDSAISIAKLKLISKGNISLYEASLVEIRNKERWQIKFKKYLGTIEKGYHRGWMKYKHYFVIIEPHTGKIKRVRTFKSEFSNYF